MTSVLIMARAPRPGQAKTRLEPLLGADGCAALQAQLIRHTATWAARAADRTWVAFTPPDAAEEVSALLPARTTLLAQANGDLGARLQAATAEVFRGHRGPLAVIGVDAPLLGQGQLRAAVRALEAGHDACLVPALDGGYALIALARPAPEAFALPTRVWGGPAVLELTLAALRHADLSYRLLEAVADVDTPQDALALRAHPRCPSSIRAALRAPSVAPAG